MKVSIGTKEGDQRKQDFCDTKPLLSTKIARWMTLSAHNKGAAWTDTNDSLYNLQSESGPQQLNQGVERCINVILIHDHSRSVAAKQWRYRWTICTQVAGH